MKRKLVKTAAALLIAVGGVSGASAHEMFLKANNYVQPANSEQTVSLINGTFDKSENAIDRARMNDVTVLGAGKKSHPANDSWTDDETTSYLKYKTGKPGTYVVGVSTKPKVLTMSREDFIAYLKHDGVLDTLDDFTKNSKLEEVSERYSKHVRAVVQVGGERTDDYAEKLGYPVEIILDQNPYDLRFGDELGFQVLYKGEPAAHQIVRASYEGFHGHDASGGHINSVDMRTDAEGRAKFLLSNKAVWYLSLIHMEKVDEPDVDYESNWATITSSVN